MKTNVEVPSNVIFVPRSTPTKGSPPSVDRRQASTISTYIDLGFIFYLTATTTFEYFLPSLCGHWQPCLRHCPDPILNKWWAGNSNLGDQSDPTAMRLQRTNRWVSSIPHWSHRTPHHFQLPTNQRQPSGQSGVSVWRSFCSKKMKCWYMKLLACFHFYQRLYYRDLEVRVHTFYLFFIRNEVTRWRRIQATITTLFTALAIL